MEQQIIGILKPSFMGMGGWYIETSNGNIDIHGAVDPKLEGKKVKVVGKKVDANFTMSGNQALEIIAIVAIP
jgi:hypothetical protein